MIRVLVYSDEYAEPDNVKTVSAGNMSNIPSLNDQLERLKREGVNLIHSVTTLPYFSQSKGKLMVSVTIVYDNGHGEEMVCGPFIKGQK